MSGLQAQTLTTEEPTEYVFPALYAAQRAAIANDKRYSIIEASTKSGKTIGCIIWLLSTALAEGRDGRVYWWIAPVWGQAKIAYRRTKLAIEVGEDFVAETCDALKQQCKSVNGPPRKRRHMPAVFHEQ